MLILKKEVPKLEMLKRGIVLYRLAFGQPRQEELMVFLGSNLGEGEMYEAARTSLISLKPPAFAEKVGGGLVSAVDENSR